MPYNINFSFQRCFARTVLVTLVGLVPLAGSVGVDGAGAAHHADPGRAVFPSHALTLARPRVVVIKSKRLLHLFDGDHLVRTYPIDLGFAPVGQKIRKNDGRTPEGSFRVASINRDSPYTRFLGISYPDRRAVERGQATGYLSEGDAEQILAALEADRRPDWNTGLGGGVGIHGHRRGVDWTAGCVALFDEHVEELYHVLRVGDPVEILP